jgi:hypothetical protein
MASAKLRALSAVTYEEAAQAYLVACRRSTSWKRSDKADNGKSHWRVWHC